MRGIAGSLKLRERPCGIVRHRVSGKLWLHHPPNAGEQNGGGEDDDGIGCDGVTESLVKPSANLPACSS